uniref:CLIP domain-containing serine protease n=1 Tax=Photinus pyralis TaxID=7054 RepID=A0A1Y1MQ98_PHOPY
MDKIHTYLNNSFNFTHFPARGSQCYTPNQENGQCIPVSACLVIDKAVKAKDRIAVDFARESQCGYDLEPLVCCGTIARPLKERLTSHRLLPSTQQCGFEKAKNRVYGGHLTDKDELPWMTLLRYKNTDTSDAGFKCGGTLISNRYVLTAAHCVIVNIYEGYQVDSVRLGEWRISTEQDCENLANPECADPVVDVKIEETIPHKDYNRRTGKSDIALIRLARSVPFTEYIRPICIPHPNLPEPRDNTELLVAGWGATENSSSSDYKLKAKVPIVSREACSMKIRQRGPITDVQICAGGSDGKDTCQGDSGGPLLGQFPEVINDRQQFYQEGVVAWGVGCGVQGFPAVYTRVAKYATWITDNLRT